MERVRWVERSEPAGVQWRAVVGLAALEPPYNLAGIPRVAFLSKLADYGVDTFDMTEDEFAQETRLA